MRRQLVLLPILFGFFVMGFADIISTALIRIEEECRLSAFAAAVPGVTFGLHMPSPCTICFRSSSVSCARKWA